MELAQLAIGTPCIARELLPNTRLAPSCSWRCRWACSLPTMPCLHHVALSPPWGMRPVHNALRFLRAPPNCLRGGALTA